MKRTRFSALIAAAAILILLVAIPAIFAQGDDDPDALLENVTVRPISDIVDEALIIQNFASDGTATLPIQTRVPVACTMVYGTTPEFGSITLDQDMAGGAHADHSPILSGLEPDTLYYFRVQGVDAAGTLYISEVMTFTTPAFETEEVTNLLSPDLGAEVTGYSSAFGGADPDARWGVLSAFDGSANSEWSSAGDGDNAWVEVKLAKRAKINRVEFWTRTMPNDTAQIFQFMITTGSGEEFGPFDLPDAEQSYTFDVEIVAETLRFDVMSSNGGNTGAVEIAVYGEFVE